MSDYDDVIPGSDGIPAGQGQDGGYVPNERHDRPTMTTVEMIAQVAAWSEAIDNYRTMEAREIAQTLAPMLEKAGAIDRSTAISVGAWMYWVQCIGSQKEIEREYILGK